MNDTPRPQTTEEQTRPTDEPRRPVEPETPEQEEQERQRRIEATMREDEGSRSLKQIMDEEWKKLPPEIRRAQKPAGDPIEWLAKAMFGGLESEWEKERMAYMNRFFRDVAFMTRLLTLGFFESNLGRGYKADLIRLRAIRRWINEQTKEFKDIEISVGTKRGYYLKHAIDTGNELEAWAWMTSLGMGKDLRNKDIEDWYRRFVKEKDVIYEEVLERINPETGQREQETPEKVLRDENGNPVRHHVGDPQDLGIEISTRRTAVASGEYLIRTSFRDAIKDKSGRVIGVRMKTADELLQDADETIQWGAGARHQAPPEVDFQNRYGDSHQVQGAVTMLEHQIDRLRRWAAQTTTPADRQHVEQEIKFCRSEMNALAPYNERTGQRDYSKGVGRVKSFMIDWSTEKPAWLMENELVGRRRPYKNSRPLTFQTMPGENGEPLYVWDVAMDLAYMKWLWSFNPKTITGAQRLTIANLYNWQDLMSGDRAEAFQARIVHPEYGARNPKGDIDERKKTFFDDLEASGGVPGQETAHREHTLLDAYQSTDRMFGERQNERRRLFLDARSEIEHLSAQRIDAVVRDVLQFVHEKGRDDLIGRVKQQREGYLEKIWGDRPDLEEQGALYELAPDDDQAILQAMRNRYLEAKKAREISRAAAPLLKDLIGAYELVKEPAFQSISKQDIERNQPAYRERLQEFAGFDSENPNMSEQLPRFVQKAGDMLGYTRSELEQVIDDLNAGRRDAAATYEEVRKRLKAFQLRARAHGLKDKVYVEPNDRLVDLYKRRQVDSVFQHHNGFQAELEREIIRDLPPGGPAATPEEIDAKKVEKTPQLYQQYIDRLEENVVKALQVTPEQLRQFERKRKEARGRTETEETRREEAEEFEE